MERRVTHQKGEGVTKGISPFSVRRGNLDLVGEERPGEKQVGDRGQGQDISSRYGSEEVIEKKNKLAG